jgi:hypothetical protein
MNVALNGFGDESLIAELKKEILSLGASMEK